MSDPPPICDYEGSDYRTRFWEGKGRDYEDLVERIALRRLLPPDGQTLIDLGAGYGRLADEYQGYETVVLFDYSRSLLHEARSRLGEDPRYRFVAGNWYQMPFASGVFDALVQVRTLHHAADVPALLGQLARISRPGGCYILEFANKRNLKAILRYIGRRQSWSPFALEPVEFAKLNFDFHPTWLRIRLEESGFQTCQTLTVSHFRFAPIKRVIPTGLLVAADRMLQPTGRWFQLTPSVFFKIRSLATGTEGPASMLFACPRCHAPLTQVHDDRFLCTNSTCQLQWAYKDGIHDFKEPIGSG